MSYFLIGESHADDAPLFVLWTFDADGVRVLPIGSRDRCDMQAVGRCLFEATTPGADPHETLEPVMASEPRRWNGRPLRLLDLDDEAREEIGRSIAGDLETPDDEQTAPAA